MNNSIHTLSNFLTGTAEHINAVLEGGIVAPLIAFLGFPYHEFKDEIQSAIITLGNMAGLRPEFRDRLIREGALISGLKLIRTHSQVCMQVIAAYIS